MYVGREDTISAFGMPEVLHSLGKSRNRNFSV